MKKELFYTKSVCPVCLKEIAAKIVEVDEEIYMEKECGEHGHFQTVIWQECAESYLEWLEFGGIDPAIYPKTKEQAISWRKGFDFSSNTCVQSCSSALMTTNRCNMNCPVCFTRDRGEEKYEPSIKEIRVLLGAYKEKAGEDAILELCGGEPTVRNDLFEVVQCARELGFDYIQLNTNGIKLAQSAIYCKELKKSGVTTIYLGFDGISEEPYIAKYGCPMVEIKKKAVTNCEKAGLAVVLVVCVIPGENDQQLGEIVHFAKEHMPTVKGVHFQPISYFGIYDKEKIKRITIPAVLRKLEQQTEGEIRKEDFAPASYEHAQCSFYGNYIKSSDGCLKRVTKYCKKNRDLAGYRTIRKTVRKTWLPSQYSTLTIGGMAFQDAWNIDLLRVSRCSVHIIGKDEKMIPLCSKYLTDCSGKKLNCGIS